MLCGSKDCLCGFQRYRETVFWLAVWAVFGSCLDGVWVFLHLQCPDGVCIGWACALWLQFFGLRFGWCLGLFASAVSRWCLHRLGMCSVAPKLFYVVPDGVCIGWACALWLQRLFYVESKGNVKQFFGLRFGRFSARV